MAVHAEVVEASCSPTSSASSGQQIVWIGEWWLNANWPAGAEQPGGLRHGPVRIGEAHRAVVAEHDVEARVGQRHRLGAGMDEREVDAGLGHQSPGVLELAI